MGWLKRVLIGFVCVSSMACAAWIPQDLTANAAPEGTLRVTLASGEQIVMTNALVMSDSIRGQIVLADGASRATGGDTAFARADVTGIEQRSSQTAIAIVFVLVAGLIAGAIAIGQGFKQL